MKYLLATLAAATLATPIWAQSAAPIADVDVVVEESDFDESNALRFYPTLEGDMEAAFDDAITGRQSGTGYDVTVRLSEVSLSGAQVLEDGGEFNTISGWVYLREEPGAEPTLSRRITITAEGRSGGNDQVEIVPGTQLYYDAMVNAFAARTLAEIDGAV